MKNSVENFMLCMQSAASTSLLPPFFTLQSDVESLQLHASKQNFSRQQVNTSRIRMPTMHTNFRLFPNHKWVKKLFCIGKKAVACFSAASIGGGGCLFAKKEEKSEKSYWAAKRREKADNKLKHEKLHRLTSVSAQLYDIADMTLHNKSGEGGWASIQEALNVESLSVAFKFTHK